MESALVVRESSDAARRKDAVARNHERQGVGSTGLPDRARRRAQLARKLAVAPGAPRFDRRDLSPDTALERRAALGKRQIEAEIRVVDVALDLRARALGEAITRRHCFAVP